MWQQQARAHSSGKHTPVLTSRPRPPPLTYLLPLYVTSSTILAPRADTHGRCVNPKPISNPNPNPNPNQVREQTRMVDASSIVLSAEDGNSANSARGGAQRRRKQLYPAPSLLPLF